MAQTGRTVRAVNTHASGMLSVTTANTTALHSRIMASQPIKPAACAKLVHQLVHQLPSLQTTRLLHQQMHRLQDQLMHRLQHYVTTRRSVMVRLGMTVRAVGTHVSGTLNVTTANTTAPHMRVVVTRSTQLTKPAACAKQDSELK